MSTLAKFCTSSLFLSVSLVSGAASADPPVIMKILSPQPVGDARSTEVVIGAAPLVVKATPVPGEKKYKCRIAQGRTSVETIGTTPTCTISVADQKAKFTTGSVKLEITSWRTKSNCWGFSADTNVVLKPEPPPTTGPLRWDGDFQVDNAPKGPSTDGTRPEPDRGLGFMGPFGRANNDAAAVANTGFAAYKKELAPQIKNGHLIFPLAFASGSYSDSGCNPNNQDMINLDIPIAADGSYNTTVSLPAANATFIRRMADKAFDDAEVAAGHGQSCNLGRQFGDQKGWFKVGGPYPKDMTTVTVSGKLELATFTFPGSDEKPITGAVTTATLVGNGTVANETERPRLKLVFRRVREFSHKTVF